MLRAALVLSLLIISSTLVRAQAEGHRIEVNGMQMYYEVSGSGDPLIVLHGAYMNIHSAELCTTESTKPLTPETSTSKRQRNY